MMTDRWLAEHADDDPCRLLLSGKTDAAGALELELRHRCRNRHAQAIATPGWRFPDRIASEQASSELTATWHSTLIPHGARVLDLTAGLGIDDMAMARAAAKVTTIECDSHRAETLRKNATAAGLDIKVICDDSAKWIKQYTGKPFDVVYADPCRRDNDGSRLYDIGSCSPDIPWLLPFIAQHAPRLIVKSSPMMDLTELARVLHASHVVAVGTKTELRECLAIINTSDINKSDISVSYEAVTLPGYGLEPISWSPNCECSKTDNTPQVDLSIPKNGALLPAPGAWIAEPYPAVMKVGHWQKLGQDFGLSQVSVDSHLYLSDSMITRFPGRWRQIEEVGTLDNRTLHQWKRRWPRMNVISRGAPLKAPQIVSRYSIREGGDVTLMVFRMNNNVVAIIAH